MGKNSYFVPFSVFLIGSFVIGASAFFAPSETYTPEGHGNTPIVTMNNARATSTAVVEQEKPNDVKDPTPPTAPKPPKKTIFSCDDALFKSPFHRDSQLQALREEKRLRAEGDIANADLLLRISCYPQGIWIIGDDINVIRNKVRRVMEEAAQTNKIPILVLYNIPDHTTLTWWSGVKNGDVYLEWIRAVASEVGDKEAWIVLEPDAIGLLPNLKAGERVQRVQELNSAIRELKNIASRSRVYLDAGHNDWRSVSVVAEYLTQSGIQNADGFSLNVSNHQELEHEIAYGEAISKQVGQKPFVIDTSRNGTGPGEEEWCNSKNVALGKTPTKSTGNALIDAFLWVKPPGESDGHCNDGPPAGKFWLERALEMIYNSPYAN